MINMPNEFESQVSDSPKIQSEHCLIIDDDPNILNLLTDLFDYNNLTSVTAETGEEGLQSMQTCLPALILLDCSLPDYSGIEILNKIRSDETVRHIPVLMITARSDIENRLLCLRSGATDYIIKPFHPEELMARVTTSLAAVRTLQLKSMITTAGTAAHHINQPLNVLMTSLELLTTLEDLGERGERMVEHCFDAVAEIASIVKKISTIREFKTTQYFGETDILDIRDK